MSSSSCLQAMLSEDRGATCSCPHVSNCVSEQGKAFHTGGLTACAAQLLQLVGAARGHLLLGLATSFVRSALPWAATESCMSGACEHVAMTVVVRLFAQIARVMATFTFDDIWAPEMGVCMDDEGCTSWPEYCALQAAGSCRTWGSTMELRVAQGVLKKRIYLHELKHDWLERVSCASALPTLGVVDSRARVPKSPHR